MSGRRWLILGGVSIAVAAVIAFVVVLLLLRSLTQPDEETAKFIPSDARIYVSFNLRPGIGQIDRGQEVLSLLKTDKLIEVRDEYLEQVKDDTGIHLLDDIRPWLGTDVSFALLDAVAEPAEWLIIAQVGDKDKALDFIEDLASYIEEATDVDVETSTYRDSDLWVAEDDYLALGLTNDYLIAGATENAVTRMIRRIESPPERSLAQDPDFMEAQESLPQDRVMFIFAQTDDLRDFLNENVDLLDTEATLNSIEDNIPDYVAMSASFIEKGMRLDVVADMPDGFPNLKLEGELRSPDALPSGTLFLIAGTGITEAWEEFRDSLRDAEPDVLEAIEDALDDLEEETGIALEQDVIDALSGEVALALLPSDIRFDDDGTPSGAIEVLLLAGVREPRSIEKALETAIDHSEDLSVMDDGTSLNGYEVVSFSVDGLDIPIDIEPTYVVTEDWAALGTTLDSLELFHTAISDANESLPSSTQFSSLVDTLPEPLHFLTYADIAGISDMVEGALAREMRRDFRREVDPFLDPFSMMLLGYTVTEQHFRLTVTLSLRES